MDVADRSPSFRPSSPDPTPAQAASSAKPDTSMWVRILATVAESVGPLWKALKELRGK